MRLLIVNYHYIRDVHPKEGIYPVSPKNFEKQLNIISKYYKFISQSELVDFIKKDSFPKGDFCLITLDDGLKEQLKALKILINLSIPAVFFISTQPHLDKIAHDVHKYHYIFSKCSDDHIYKILSNNYKIENYNFDLDLLKEEYRYDTVQKRKIKFFINFVLNETKKKEFIKTIFESLNKIDDEFTNELYMDIDDITKIGKLDMLGTHTYSHRPLSSLSKKDQIIEMKDSRIYLEKISSSKIRGISYPYGGPGAINIEVSKNAKEINFDYGLTMIRGINEESNLRSPLMLKRVDTNEAPGGKLNSNDYVP